MKKILSLLLALSFCLTLMSCAKNSSKETDTTTEGTNASVVNPMVEITDDEFAESTSGSSLVPENATEVSYFKINSEPIIYEMNFNYEGSDFTIRYSKGDEKDISGFYYTWDKTDKLENYTMHFSEDENLGFASWYQSGINYCVAATNSSYDGIIAVADMYYHFYNTDIV